VNQTEYNTIKALVLLIEAQRNIRRFRDACQGVVTQAEWIALNDILGKIEDRLADKIEVVDE